MTYDITEIVIYTGVGKWRFTVVHVEKDITQEYNNTRINNNRRINWVLYAHNCKPTFPHPCLLFN